MVVDLHEATVAQLHTGCLQSELRGHRWSSGGHQQLIRLQHGSVLEREGDRAVVWLSLHRGGAPARAHLDSLPGEDRVHLAGDVTVLPWQHLGGTLDQHHLGAEEGEHRRELAPHVSAAQDEQRLREPVEPQDPLGGPELRLGDTGKVGQRRGGAGVDHDVAAANHPAGAVIGRDLHGYGVPRTGPCP
jgi:hypothetical protein